MTRFSRRQVLATGGVAAASLALGVRSAVASEPLRIGMPAIYTPFAPMTYASDQGYLGDAEVTVYRGGGAAQEALAAGAADLVAIAPPTAAVAIQRGVNQKIIAQSGPPTLQGWYLVTAPQSGISDVRDLDGKDVGVTAIGSATDFMAAWSAHNAGISINMIPLGGGILPALRAGQILAGVIWPLASFKAIQAGEVVPLQAYGEAATNASFDMWAASGSAISEKAAQIEVFIAGVNRAIAELQSDETLALRVLAAYHDESDEALLREAYEKLILRMRPDSLPTLPGIQGTLDMAALAGMTGLPTAEEITDLHFVRG